VKSKSISRAIIISAAAGVAIYIAIAAYTGWGEVASELSHFSWTMAGLGFALAALNYLLRFAKWELYLRRLDVKIPLGDSLKIFLSGFALTVTPGKVGEVLKAYLLRETHGVPMARTAPTVVAERATDLLALVALALVGVEALGGNARVLWAAVVLVGVMVALASSRKLVHAIIDVAAKLSVFNKIAPKLREFYDATAVLLHPTPLTLATLLSVLAWAAECLAFWVVLKGFPDAQATLKLCTFIYAAMTIAGALSFLPGGLGVQEGGMVALLVSTAAHVTGPTAAAATFITRLCTLWFAVAVGLIALSLVRKKVDLAAMP
jgi:uncharacterized protein (TIRG00374 family)